MMRVINTRALVVLDQSSGKYFFYMGDRWMESSSVKGPWTQAANPPASLEQVKKAAVEQKEADLLNDPNSSLMQELSKGNVPKVYVATHPAELIQTSGTPQLQPVSGTQLLYVNNTADNIFVNTYGPELLCPHLRTLVSLAFPERTVELYFTQEPASGLRPDSRGSSEGNSPSIRLRHTSSSRGRNCKRHSSDCNRQSRSGAADHSVRRNAGVQADRRHASSVRAQQPDSRDPSRPEFYYAVQNGIWFVATSPQGPWVVAARVPAVIYTIPPSSPLYYVTYVRIYGSTPDVVYVGYTPGYLGSYYSDDGVVVYGTGYYYPGWTGSVWYGPPVTYGFGWCWGPGFGWGLAAGFGVGFFAGAAFFPWWGPWRAWGWGWGPGYHVTNVTINSST